MFNNIFENLILNEINKNPNARNLISELKASGLSAEEFFYKKANEMGINPNEIINKLR